MIFDSSVRLSPYAPAAVLRVTGEDALTFLQGQFTQELRSTRNHFFGYGLWLNQKGKVLADSFVLHDGPAWWLVSYFSPAEVIKGRLEAYIIADDVAIEDVTPEWNGYAIVGSSAQAWLKTGGVTLPPEGEFAKVGKGFVFRSRRDGAESWDWIQQRVWQVWPELVRKNDILTAEQLEGLRIAAAIPRVPVDVGPGDLPNEAGLEVDAISYSKGCYLGQEVMARLKAMGQVRRKLRRVSGALAPSNLASGENDFASLPTVPAPLFHSGKKIGELRSIAGTATGVVGLAMISLTNLGDGRTCGLSETAPEWLNVGE